MPSFRWSSAAAVQQLPSHGKHIAKPNSGRRVANGGSLGMQAYTPFGVYSREGDTAG